MIPCVWSFMKRRRIKDYVKLFKILVKEAKNYGYTLKSFELAAKKAYEQVFIEIVVKGCLFHFGQSLFKKFCALGLKSYYIEKKEEQEWFKGLFCLSLIPKANVDREFEYLSNQMTK